MQITKGLVIDTPAVDKILSGAKTWEMRSAAVKYRGPIALIRKGSGTVVGTVEITDSVGPLTREQLLANTDRHQGSVTRIESGEFDKWRHAWVLRNAKPLTRPVPYVHPSGAVIWVNLEPSVSRQLAG